MNKALILTLTLVLSGIAGIAQKTGPFVFSVAGDSVYGGEFERVFSKNSKPGAGKPTMEELEEYLQLYIKFKLKVKEAYAMGMDTNQAFKQELAGYRKQLAQPYLTDKEVTDQLMQEAFNRMQTEVRASHIMVRLSEYASPKDTLAAWKKIMQLRDRIVNNKEVFDSVAYAASDDESAKFNYGDLGFFTAFSMIYPFENMAYTTPIGQVSMPFRTQFGYHILVVKDKRAARGDVRAAHMMIRFNNDSEVEAAKKRIDAVYDKLKAGEDFNTLVQQFSEDFGTRTRNGELNWISSTANNVPEVFRETAFSLKNIGDVSVPVKSDFGWHIIKLLEKRPLGSYDDLKETIKYKVQRDQRSEKNKEVVLARLKTDNKFVENPKVLNQFIAAADTNITNTNWVANAAVEKIASQGLFTIAGNPYTVSDFVKHIKTVNTSKNSLGKETAIRNWYTDFVTTSNFTFEENNLENKYPDFNYLMQEYKDGILLFDLTDKMVWSKSVEDTSGLKKYFEANQTKYMWKERAQLEQFTCKDAATAAKVKKYLGKGYANDKLLTKVNAKTPDAVKITTRLVEQGDKTLGTIKWQTGVQDLPGLGSEVAFIRINEMIKPQPKKLQEAMGIATTDYQNYLETQWITALQEKYPVIVNPHGLEGLFK